MLCSSPALLSLELVPGAVSGGADGRHAHLSALLVQVPGLSQLIPGTEIRSYALFLPQVHQDVTMVADGVNGPDCIDCAGVVCSVSLFGFVCCWVFSYHGELDCLSVNRRHSSLLDLIGFCYKYPSQSSRRKIPQHLPFQGLKTFGRCYPLQAALEAGKGGERKK